MSKIYLPPDYVNDNFIYRAYDEYIEVITDNCEYFTNQERCETVRVYPKYDYADGQPYYTTLNQQFWTNANIVPSFNFTSDIWYRNDIANILIIFLILFIFIIKYPLRLFMRLFGRWLKL